MPSRASPGKSPLATCATPSVASASRDSSGVPGSHSSQPFQHRGLQATERRRQADDRPRVTGPAAGELRQLPERVDLGAAAFVGAARRVAVVECEDHRARDVLDPDRLQPGLGRCQRQQRQHRLHARQRVQEAVMLAEDRRGPQDRRLDRGVQRRRLQGRFAGRLRAQIVTGRVGGGAERAQMHDSRDACGSAEPRQPRGQRDVDALEFGGARVQHADQVDDGIAAGEQPGQVAVVVHVGLRDLGGGQLLQVARARRMARGHDDAADTAGALEELFANAAADEAAAAQHHHIDASRHGLQRAHGNSFSAASSSGVAGPIDVPRRAFSDGVSRPSSAA